MALQLHPALERLNRVDMAPELRFGILEALRPGLLVATASLSKRFLKQPLVMPHEPRQMADMSGLATGTRFDGRGNVDIFEMRFQVDF